MNGCAVTAEAVAKTRQAIRRALADGAGRVVVTGCAARLASAGLGDLGDRVHVIAAPSERAPDAVAELLAGLGCRGTSPATAARDRIRAFVKVQDGCSFSCSFCVIPLVRGTTRSRGLDDVLADVRRRVALGHVEIVLTGVNIGLYRDGTHRLADVIRAVGAIAGVERLRLSSIEVDHLDAPSWPRWRRRRRRCRTCTCRCSPATTACCGRCAGAPRPRAMRSGSPPPGAPCRA